MTAERPKAEELEDVPEDEYLLRFVGRAGNQYQPDPTDGRYLTEAWIPSGEFKADPAKSYGPSVWVESRLPNGVESLEALRPDWKTKGLVRVRVSDVRTCDVKVKYSPQDSTLPEHADAHASWVGLNRPKRDELVERCQTCIVRHPIEEPTKP